jgi:hypothetical protein
VKSFPPEATPIFIFTVAKGESQSFGHQNFAQRSALLVLKELNMMNLLWLHTAVTKILI